VRPLPPRAGRGDTVRQEADAGACGVAGAGRLEHAAKEKEAMARILGAMMNKMSGKPSGAGGQ
jgi:hypothetical protein